MTTNVVIGNPFSTLIVDNITTEGTTLIAEHVRITDDGETRLTDDGETRVVDFDFEVTPKQVQVVITSPYAIVEIIAVEEDYAP